MSNYDIRTGETEWVDKLIIEGRLRDAVSLIENDNTSDEVFLVGYPGGVGSEEELYLKLLDKKHAKLVIKAINHAIKLGWLDEVNDKEDS